jgi:ribosomal protein L40E
MSSIPLMTCRKCNDGTLTPEGEKLICQHCGATFDNWDDAIGDPWDEPDDPAPLDFN